MKFVRYYALEINSILILTLITLSAIFVEPDMAQKLALAYMAVSILHQWEEDEYPGGFFDMLFGEVVGLEKDKVPTHEKQRDGRIYVQTLLIVALFLPYFGHEYIWLITPIAYLGFVEGFFHTVAPRIFKMDRRTTPGQFTALCYFALSCYTFWYLISNSLVEPWQYIAGLLIILALLVWMQQMGMRLNGIKPTDMPKMIKANLKRIHEKQTAENKAS